MSEIARYDGAAASAAIDKRAAADAALFVVFRVGDADYMLGADEVLQMESFAGATSVPGAPPYVAGIVQVRGRVVPVVDLRIRFGVVPGPAALENRIVVAQHGERVVGLLVDSAKEVVKLAPSQLKAPPAILTHHAHGFVGAVVQLGPRLIMLVDFAKVIGEERV